MSAPDLTQKVIGFRRWRIDEKGDLRPVGWFGDGDDPAWSLGDERAVCRAEAFGQRNPFLIGLTGCTCPLCRPDLHAAPATAEAKHQAPHSGCQCGLYALHALPAGWDSFDPDTPIVPGAVAVWGKLEVHADGFRAERARPVVLARSDEFSVKVNRWIETAARRRGIEVVDLSELHEYAAEFGAAVPEDMRPEKGPGPYEMILQAQLQSLSTSPRGGATRSSTASPFRLTASPLWTPESRPPRPSKIPLAVWSANAVMDSVFIATGNPYVIPILLLALVMVALNVRKLRR